MNWTPKFLAKPFNFARNVIFLFSMMIWLVQVVAKIVQVSMMQGGGNTKGNFNTIYQTFKF